MNAQLWALLSMLVICTGAVIHPRRAECPPGWYVEGVQPSGSFVCKRVPIGDDHRNARGILVDDSIQPPGRLEGMIWCLKSGELPQVFDAHTVGCRYGRYQ